MRISASSPRVGFVGGMEETASNREPEKLFPMLVVALFDRSNPKDMRQTFGRSFLSNRSQYPRGCAEWPNDI